MREELEHTQRGPHSKRDCDYYYLYHVTEEELADARAVANWLHARLYEAHRQGKQLGPGDAPSRDWLSFENEPEACP